MRHSGIVFAFIFLYGLGASTVRAEEMRDLRGAVEAQGSVIDELREELERVRSEQGRAQDRVLALEDQLALRPVSAAGPSESGITADYIDRRIEAFQTSDNSRFFMSGYGNIRYRDVMDDGDIDGNPPSTYLVQFNPIFHFRLTDRLHFNAELEFELDDGGETEVELEFATIDYLLNDWLTLSAGKFFTPFNVFGADLHPAWINKMASRPVIYDKNKGVIPVMTDVGIMASGGAPLWNEDSKFNYAVYTGNGPVAEDEDEPALEFENTPDENNNKTSGGRIGFLPIPNLELGASWSTGRTKGPGGRFNLLGSDLWYWNDGLELRGEYVRLSRKSEDRLDKWGYYLQVAYRMSYYLTDPTGWSGVVGRFEPVIRWGQTKGFNPDNRDQLALGLNYWLYPSVPLKLTYEFNQGKVKNDRLFLQLAYGF